MSYTTDSQGALRGALQHVHTVAVTTTAGTRQLECQKCEVTFDEAWSPTVQARLTLAADAQPYEDLDARLAPRLRVTAGYRLPGRLDDTALLADLVLTGRTTARPADTTEIAAESDEALTQDCSPPKMQFMYGINATAGPALTELIRTAIPGAAIQIDPTIAKTKFIRDEVMTVQAGDDLWDAIADITDRCEAWTRVRDDRTWLIGPRPTAAEPQWMIGPHDTINTASTVERREYANAVLVIHQWTDPTAPSGTDAGRRVVGWAEVTSGPLSVTSTPRRTKVVHRRTASDAAGATAAARAILLRAMTKGHTATFTAPAAYWLRPGHTIVLRLATGQAHNVIITAITFRPHEGLMDITVRYPELGSITAGGE